MIVVSRYLMVQQVFSFEMGKWECFFFCWGLGGSVGNVTMHRFIPPKSKQGAKSLRFNDQRSFQWTWTYCGTRWVIQQKAFQLPVFFFLVFPSLSIGGLGGLVVWYSDWIPKHERDGFLGSTRFESQTTNLPFVFPFSTFQTTKPLASWWCGCAFHCDGLAGQAPRIRAWCCWYLEGWDIPTGCK